MDPLLVQGVQLACDHVATSSICDPLGRVSTARCGDGATVGAIPPEECDDGNLTPGDCCSPTRRVEPGCP